MHKIKERIYHFRCKMEESVLYRLYGNKRRIKLLRKWGVKIGEDCLIFAKSFDTEPYLIEIGDHVAIAAGVRFITHDGGVWAYRYKYPEIDCFGKIKIGNNCFIGLGSIILPNTVIGDNCIVGAGSVVRGTIADNSVIMGNPAKVIMKGSFLESLYKYNKNTLHIKKLSDPEKKRILLKHFNIS